MNAQRIWQGWQSDEGGWKTLVLIILWGAFFAVVLTGCATSAVRDRIVEVSKPVAVHPITAAQIPAVPAPLGPRPSSLSAPAVGGSPKGFRQVRYRGVKRLSQAGCHLKQVANLLLDAVAASEQRVADIANMLIKPVHPVLKSRCVFLQPFRDGRLSRRGWHFNALPISHHFLTISGLVALILRPPVIDDLFLERRPDRHLPAQLL
jgi:hypothetical protein